MGLKAIFTESYWAAVPFHFWSGVFFVLGSMVGSFLNVCIHRLPRGESIVSPPSHCPHCGYAIPWYLNIPLFTWIWLGGKCANCRALISIRYFLVELLTGSLFLGCWLIYGHQSVLLALVYCTFLAGLVAAAFIDLEHFIIPDSITFGGIGVGLICSLLVPGLHDKGRVLASLGQGTLGCLIGGAVVYSVVRLAKLRWGRRRLKMEPSDKIIFGDSSLLIPGEEIPYAEMFYRKTDTLKLEAIHAELCDRCYQNVPVRLTAAKLRIGDEEFDPETVPYLEVTTEEVIIPREAMGLGDVKFMAAIGAFLGWPATFFCLGVSSLIGAPVGLVLIALRRHEQSKPIPYGPFIAIAAALWVFGGKRVWFSMWGY